MENLSAADVAAVTRGGYGYGYGNYGNCGGFMGEGIWLFAILALMWGGNGLFGGRGNFAGEEMSNSLQTNILEASANQRENCSQFTSTNANITNGFANLSRDLCSQSFGITNQINNTTSDIKDRIANLSAQNAQCCCDELRAIDSVNFNAALNTASINANTTAGIQKVLDTLCQDKIDALRGRVNQLELQNQLCGIVRYPTQATFNAGFPFGFPFGFDGRFGGFNGCGCGCGCNNI